MIKLQCSAPLHHLLASVGGEAEQLAADVPESLVEELKEVKENLPENCIQLKMCLKVELPDA